MFGICFGIWFRICWGFVHPHQLWVIPWCPGMKVPTLRAQQENSPLVWGRISSLLPPFPTPAAPLPTRFLIFPVDIPEFQQDLTLSCDICGFYTHSHSTAATSSGICGLGGSGAGPEVGLSCGILLYPHPGWEFWLGRAQLNTDCEWSLPAAPCCAHLGFSPLVLVVQTPLKHGDFSNSASWVIFWGWCWLGQSPPHSGAVPFVPAWE